MPLENTVFYLIGFAGTGKYTIARALCELLPCKLVDNHYILNPIFNLIEQDGLTTLPPLVWEYAMQVHLAVLGTIKQLSPAQWNFIFTNELIDDPKGSSQSLYTDILEVASLRSSRFVPVRLLCDPEEHLRRVSRPERRERMKSVSLEDARQKQGLQLFSPPHPNTLTLDVTPLSPSEAARRILEHAEVVK